MKFTFAFLAAVLLIGGTASLTGQTLNWHNSVFDSVVDSEGAPLDDSYTIELGVFADDFVQIESNVDEWASNWVVFDRAEFDPALGYFAGVAQMLADGTSSSAEMTPGAPSFANEMAYIWIRNSDLAEPGSEWLLLSDESWVFPTALTDCCGNSVPLEWAASDLDSGDVPDYGRQGATEGPGVFTSTDPSELQTYTFAIPEPSTVGLLMMACFSLLRRRRA